jgi:hypothetical protein
MKWSWKLAQVAGIEVYVHATFVLLIGWVALNHGWRGAAWPPSRQRPKLSVVDSQSAKWRHYHAQFSVLFGRDKTPFHAEPIHLQLAAVRKVMALLKEIEQAASTAPMDLGQHASLFVEAANLIFPQGRNRTAINTLEGVLSSTFV